jgi:hypothetical protein
LIASWFLKVPGKRQERQNITPEQAGQKLWDKAMRWSPGLKPGITKEKRGMWVLAVFLAITAFQDELNLPVP